MGHGQIPMKTGHRDTEAQRGKWNAFHSSLCLCVSVAILLCSFALKTEAADLRVYETKYYSIHTDLSEDDARECAIRMTKMAEEYHDRTRDFAGAIRSRLPFYLYRNQVDYLIAGGIDGSAGYFSESKNMLVALAGEQIGPRTWHIVQHEGFHQFAAAVMGGSRPPWVNEGIA